LVAKMVCGMGGGDFEGWAVWPGGGAGVGVVLVAGGTGIFSSNEYPVAAVALTGALIDRLSGFGCEPWRTRMKARKIPPTEKKRISLPVGFLKNSFQT